MQNKIPAIFKSKKFQAAVSGIWLLLTVDPVPGMAVSEKTMMGIIAIVVGYLYSQGMADNGKEKAKLEIGERNLEVGKGIDK